jgi:hypothetical protein
MALALVDKLKASAEASYDGLMPATDGDARPVIKPDEVGNCASFALAWVNAAVQPSDEPAECWVGNFDEHPSDANKRDAKWELTLTPRRLLLWSPLTANFFNKMKAKAGTASGGQIRYEWLDDIERTSSLELTFLFDAQEGGIAARRIVKLEFASPQDAATISAALADRTAAYWREQGIDTPALQDELNRLRNIDWGTWQSLQLSLLKAGAKPKYVG